ncbi:MAG: glutathione S-transferase family protein [Steroidobacteraceae bacterium]
MSTLTLVIGNKNYSSWSLRPWMLLKHLGLAFDEVLVQLDTPQFKAQVAEWSPALRVPVLRDGALRIWDSLAICEYACELAGRGWPRDPADRARARSLAAEMHSGFQVLRSTWPMIASARNRRTTMTPELAAEVKRIDSAWSQCRGEFGARGPWLFGAEYCVTDAMFAPVVLRFLTYGASLSAAAAAYVEHALADPILREWMAAAEAESWVIPQYEK